MFSNWMTLTLIGILFGSIILGALRRFATELGYVLSRIISTVVAIGALWFAWLGSTQFMHYVTQNANHFPKWGERGVQIWKKIPGGIQTIVFFVIYLLDSCKKHVVDLKYVVMNV